jgi:DNA polymerase elongation subunit (family B)
LIASCTGWLLDVSVDQDKAVLWIKTGDKKILKLTDSYQPFFYMLARNEQDGHYLFHILSQQSIVKKVSWKENKLTNLFDEEDKLKLICAFPESVQYYAVLLKKLEKDRRVKQLFNTDFSHVQQYLFHRLKVEPTSKVEVQYDGSRLITLTKVDENEISPPPFSMLYVSVYTSSGKVTSEDPVIMIRVRYEDVQDSLQQQREEILFNYKEEKSILEEFCKYVQAKDPDIIVYTGDHHTSIILDYLFARTDKLGLDLQLGRDKNNDNDKVKTLKHPGLQWIKGRLSISCRNNHSSSLYNFGLAGLIERCRFSFLPVDFAAKYGMNRIIDSRNCYELIQRGFVIPSNNKANNKHEHIRTIEELVPRDRGGMIISPQIGLHENVLVLDYDSEYTNLIEQKRSVTICS